MGSGTPDISNMTRPGFTTATQWSGAPLPEPMRTSAGFFVTGLSGKTRIQTRPPRLMWWVIARRAASIWRLVSQQTSSAMRPKSPKLTVVPPFAIPARRPRWTLRCLTRLGISIGQASSDPASVASDAGWSTALAFDDAFGDGFLAGSLRARVVVLPSALVDRLERDARLGGAAALAGTSGSAGAGS